MKLLFPLRVVAGRVIVDREDNIVATVHARRQLGVPGEVHDSEAIHPTDADENVHEIVELLNAAVGTAGR